MGSAKRDYTASLIIGILAALLSKIMIDNLNIDVPYLLVAGALFVACPAGIFIARLLGKKVLTLYQFVKFGETGGLNTFVDLGILNLLILVTGFSTGIYYILFKGISFVCAVTNSYFWNKHWVFEAKKGKVADEGEMLKFFAVSITGFIINITVAALFVTIGRDIISVGDKLMANMGAAVAFIATMMFNFVGYKLFVFAKAKVKGKNVSTKTIPAK